jgi:hypothetical protein
MAKQKNICRIEGCGRFCSGRGLCSKHYARLLRGRDPEAISRKEPNLVITNGDTSEMVLRDMKCNEIARVTVDTDDLPMLKEYVWSYNVGSGYAYSHTKGPTAMMHKLIAKTPEVMLTDHINSNRLDNRKANLRYATATENAQHTNPWTKETKHSKHKGVCLLANREWPLKKPWMAYIGINGKRQYLGYYETQDQAALAYDHAARENFGEFARPNFA